MNPTAVVDQIYQFVGGTNSLNESPELGIGWQIIVVSYCT